MRTILFRHSSKQGLFLPVICCAVSINILRKLVRTWNFGQISRNFSFGDFYLCQKNHGIFFSNQQKSPGTKIWRKSCIKSWIEISRNKSKTITKNWQIIAKKKDVCFWMLFKSDEKHTKKIDILSSEKIKSHKKIQNIPELAEWRILTVWKKVWHYGDNARGN